MTFNRSSFDDFLLTQGCLAFYSPPISLECGRWSGWDINLQNLYANLNVKRRLAHYVYTFALEQGLKPDLFLGVPMRAIPLGESVNELIDYKDPNQIPATILRMDDSRNGDPSLRYVVGPLNAGQHVVLIDDTVVTGTSFMRYVSRLQDNGIIVDGVIVGINRLEKMDNGRTADRLLKEAYGVSLYCLTDVSSLLPKAIQSSDMPHETVQELKQYYHKYGIYDFPLEAFK
jgi:orotate phosphoribosyltransferase